jgi:hypothetical protein
VEGKAENEIKNYGMAYCEVSALVFSI